MNFLYRNGTSLALMGGSLALLAVFIGIWLSKVYKDEYERLKEQTDFLLLESVREMEDGLFASVLTDDDSPVHTDTTLGTVSNKIVIHHQVDTAKVIYYEHKQSLTDTNFEFTVRSNLGESKIEKPIKGSLAFIVAVAEREHSLDSFSIKLDSLDIKPILSKQIELALEESKLPSSARLIGLNREDTAAVEAILSTSYQDILNGERYAIEVPKYRAYLFRKMTPQLLFGLLLFASVSLAFFVVYRSLLKQIGRQGAENVSFRKKRTRAPPGNRRSELLVGEVLKSMKLHVEKLGAQVRFEAKGEAFTLDADPIHLTSVVYNLLDNALKYSPDKPEIDIELSQTETALVLSVRDRGIGIPAEHIERIFGQFYRVPTGDTHNVKGHGLGLSYVATVVRRHRGKIEVQSKPGQGSVFTITLPRTHEPD
ncbi:MAG: ATP-binding protein [Saprospirales bacterium]|nr:ATP-binding protein [Saprospirales bacterium]